MKKGSKMTEEQRQRNIEAQKKVWSNPKLRKRHSEIHKGQIAWNKGISPSKETIEKQKETYQRTLLANPEIREKMRLAKIGKKRSEESMRKFKLAMKGHKVSEETRKKISESQRGKIIPEEIKRKSQEATLKAMNSPEMKKRLSEMKKEQFKQGKAKSWNKGRKGVYSKELLEKWSKSHKERMANPEIRKILRKNILKMYESGTFPKQTNTLPERMIKEEIIKRGYKEETDFIHQYKFMDKFMCDFCFPKNKVVVEIDGDFWHANPKKYPEGSKMHKHQIKGINRDKSKNAYISKVDNGTWTIVRLWESDIKKDVAGCVDKIEEILKKKK